jgi:hypothetical protein
MAETVPLLSRAASHSKVNRLAVTTRPKKTLSRVTNGRDLVLDLDQRSREYRRFRDILCQIIADLGGAEQLSEGQRQLARRCATIAIECERMESQSVAGKKIDLEIYGALTDRLGRAFSRLGLKRVAKDVTPTLGSLLRHDGGER